MSGNNNSKYVLLSIQPQYADKIFAGAKTVELRRIFPKVEQSQWVIVYVSNPIKAIIGAFQINHIIEDDLDIVWGQVKDMAGITREEFDSYYNGINTGYGIFIKQTIKYPEPIPLKQIREQFDNFSVPQNFRYMDSQIASNLNLLSFEHHG